MQVMLLAAGRGTRLGELGRRIPKALAPLRGRPLLAYQLDYLQRQNASRVVVNAHHLADQIVAFAAGEQRDLDLQVVVEEQLLGSAGGLRNALGRFDPGLPVVVLNADTLVDAPVADLLAAHADAGAAVTIATAWLDDTEGKGIVEVDAAGRAVGIREKPVPAPPGWVNAGLYVFEPSAIRCLRRGSFADIALDLLPAILETSVVQTYPLDHSPLDIGTLEALAEAHAAFPSTEAQVRT